MSTEHLETIFDADRRLREAEAALLQTPRKALATLLADAVDEAVALDDRAEAEMRLERLADLCAQVPGPAMADALIRILDDHEPRVRVAAGEALLDVAYDYYAEVARAIERSLDAGSQVRALAELPFLLVEVGEPSAGPLLRRFLAHRDAHVVAAATEAAADLGEESLADAIEQLLGDTRDVTLDELEDGTSATVGQLAMEALGRLRPSIHEDLG